MAHPILNQIANLVMKPLLQSPLHGFASKQILLVTFRGRKSGKTYMTPVQYRREGDCIEFITSTTHQWWKNLQPDQPIVLRVEGRLVRGNPQVITNAVEPVAPYLRRMYPTMPNAQIEQIALTSIVVRVRDSAQHPGG